MRELYQSISEYVGVLNSGLIASELYLNNINENNFDKVVNTRSKIEEKRLQFIKSDRRSFKMHDKINMELDNYFLK